MSTNIPEPARAVRERPLAAFTGALAVLAAVAGLVVLTVRPAEAEPEPVPVALGSLIDPVGAAAANDLAQVATATEHLVAAATPPPPPPTACPVPGAEFIDSWGYARSGGRRHKGVDMMAPSGAPVLAPVAGTIRPSSSSLGGLGFYLTDDDGNDYFGSHLATLTVRDGRVEAGTQIGTVGTSGNASTPHLHFEVMPAGAGSANPYPFVAAWCGRSDVDPSAGS